MKVLSTLLFLTSPLLSFSKIVKEPVIIDEWDVSDYQATTAHDAAMKVSNGINITFTYSQGIHSVVEFHTLDDFQNCNIAQATALAGDDTTEYVLSSTTRSKPFLLASGVTGACDAGHKIKIKYAKKKPIRRQMVKTMQYCKPGSTTLNYFDLNGKVIGNNPAKGPKKCAKECIKNPACMGGEWHVSVSGFRADKVLKKTCTLYSDTPVPSGFKPSSKREKSVCFHPKVTDSSV